MARKSFEVKLLEWIVSNKEKVSSHTFNEIYNLAKSNFPNAVYDFDKKAGRPKSKLYVDNDFLGLFEKPWITEISMWRFAICMDKLNIWAKGATLKDKYYYLTKEVDFKKEVSLQYFSRKYNECNINKPKKNGDYPYRVEEMNEDLKEVKSYLAIMQEGDFFADL